jgi:hypothetical protein
MLPSLLLAAWVHPQEDEPETRFLRGQEHVATELLVVTDASRVSGDVDSGEALRGLVDLSGRLDLERLADLPGRLHLGLQVIRGDDGQALTGNLQGFSSVDAEEREQVARLYWEREPAGPDGLRVRLGKLDANAVFAVAEAGAPFLSPSAGYSPTILGLPTYPDPAFGATVGRFDQAGSGLRLGVFDGAGALGTRTGSRGPATLPGAPSALFWIGEGAWTGERNRLLVGGWWLDAELPRFDGGKRDGTGGLYLVAERRVLGARDASSGALDLFAQAGNGPAALSPFRRHLAAGALWSGPLAARPDDLFGLYATHVRAGDDPALDRERELGLELLTSFALTDSLRLEPDVQFVRGTGGAETVDAWVATLRLVLSL